MRTAGTVRVSGTGARTRPVAQRSTPHWTRGDTGAVLADQARAALTSTVTFGTCWFALGEGSADASETEDTTNGRGGNGFEGLAA